MVEFIKYHLWEFLCKLGKHRWASRDTMNSRMCLKCFKIESFK